MQPGAAVLFCCLARKFPPTPHITILPPILGSLARLHTTPRWLVIQSSSSDTNRPAKLLASWGKLFRPQYDDGTSGLLRRPMKIRSEVFQPFFHFPYILHVRAIARIKLIQTLITTVAAPICIVAYLNNTLANQTLVFYLMGANMFALVSLAVVTYWFQRWIGRMYMNADQTQVVFSHLTFFGNRHDVRFPIKDIVPLDPVMENSRNWCVTVRRFSDPKDVYYLCTKFGGVMDAQAFATVFGEPPALSEALKMFDKKSPLR